MGSDVFWIKHRTSIFNSEINGTLIINFRDTWPRRTDRWDWQAKLNLRSIFGVNGILPLPQA